jgi:hypothetical protein
MPSMRTRRDSRSTIGESDEALAAAGGPAADDFATAVAVERDDDSPICKYMVREPAGKEKRRMLSGRNGSSSRKMAKLMVHPLLTAFTADMAAKTRDTETSAAGTTVT